MEVGNITNKIRNLFKLIFKEILLNENNILN